MRIEKSMIRLQIRYDNKKDLCYYVWKASAGPGGAISEGPDPVFDLFGLPPGKETGALRSRAHGGASLPILDHVLEFLDQGIDLFKVLPASFLGLQIEGSTKSDHVS